MKLDALRIAVLESDPDPARHQRAGLLAKRLHLELTSAVTPELDGVLLYHDQKLELRLFGCGSRRQAVQRLTVDFLSDRMRYRYHHQRSIRQPIARAAGLKPGHRPRILDATAGLGVDAFILAGLGCSVTLAERCSLMWALLDDGLIRGRQDRRLGELLRERMTLVPTDSRALLKHQTTHFDTVYLDPMYPERTGNALSKLDIRLLRSIVGPDDDWHQLLHQALRRAGKRVVLKRPRQVSPTQSPPPNFSVSGKKHRWDVYLTAHL